LRHLSRRVVRVEIGQKPGRRPRYRKFESISLQQRVRCEPDFILPQAAGCIDYRYRPVELPGAPLAIETINGIKVVGIVWAALASSSTSAL
jgi:hypothetical protein